MILNYEQIKNLGLLQNFDDKNFENASYDLCIDKIITVNGTEEQKLALKPNSMAVAISKESVKLPTNIVGHAYVRTRLSQKGIMANNIGVIDPGYEGPLSSVLVNFGEKKYLLEEGAVFLRLTFSEIEQPQNNIALKYGPFKRKEYKVNQRSKAMRYLGNAFINIEEIVKTNVENTIDNKIKNFGLWFLAIGLILTGIGLIISFSDDDSVEIKNLQEQINLFNSNQNILLENQRESKLLIDSLNSEIENLPIIEKKPKNDSIQSK